jgi:hypothetical protein
MTLSYLSARYRAQQASPPGASGFAAGVSASVSGSSSARAGQNVIFLDNADDDSEAWVPRYRERCRCGLGTPP